ncbi:hypothetical protein ACTXT7_001425 [Hymenolepis weldensis]
MERRCRPKLHQSPKYAPEKKSITKKEHGTNERASYEPEEYQRELVFFPLLSLDIDSQAIFVMESQRGIKGKDQRF